MQRSVAEVGVMLGSSPCVTLGSGSAGRRAGRRSRHSPFHSDDRVGVELRSLCVKWHPVAVTQSKQDAAGSSEHLGELQSGYLTVKQLECKKLQVGQHLSVCRMFEVIKRVCVSSLGCRYRRLPAVLQASDSLPDTVSCLFPEQAEAQLSAKTQGTPTVSPLCAQNTQTTDTDVSPTPSFRAAEVSHDPPVKW